jgi:hypothetical protein
LQIFNIFSQRTGHVRVLSFKLAIAVLCQGPLEEKYRCEFQMNVSEFLNVAILMKRFNKNKLTFSLMFVSFLI